MNLLQMLLGGQAQMGRAGQPNVGQATPGYGEGRPFEEGNTEVQDIPVMGTRLPVREIPKEETRSVKATSKKQEMQDPTAELIKRKGLFGTSGVLRDALGLLGDAFLVNDGKQAVYRPQRERERLSSAQYGFTADPLAAIERVAEVDPNVARDMYKDYETGQTNKAVRQSQIDNREAQTADRKYKMQQDFGNYAARLLSAADTPAKQAAAMKVLANRALTYGIDLEELGIDMDIDEDERAILGSGDMTVNQQQQIPMRKRQLDISQQNADANTTRANRPPAGRAAPNPTNASMISDMVAKIKAGKTLTPGEQKVYDDLRPSRGKSTGKRALPPLPPGF